jgi:hypothetical protein
LVSPNHRRMKQMRLGFVNKHPSRSLRSLIESNSKRILFQVRQNVAVYILYIYISIQY